MINAKNRLQELLMGRGLPGSLAVYTSTQAVVGGVWTSTVVVELPTQAPVTGCGVDPHKRQAEVAAAEDALASLATTGGAGGQDWGQIYAEAQAGDALLKLVGYLAAGAASPEERSRWLQRHESNDWLADVFDRWREDGDPDLIAYGRGLGVKNKSTLVEALLWRRYGARVLGPGAVEALKEIGEAIQGVPIRS